MPNSQAQMMENIRLGMQSVRGRNEYRGREEYFASQGLVILPMESRGADLAQGQVRIHFGKREVETWGEVLPGGKSFRLEDFGMDLDLFLAHAAQLARGGRYLQTHPKKAPYRDLLKESPDTGANEG